jgi:hypothetical protein
MIAFAGVGIPLMASETPASIAAISNARIRSDDGV